MILVFLSYPICLFSVIFLKLLITWTLNKLEFFSISLEGLSYQELTVRNHQYKKPGLAQETMLTLVKCSLKLQSLQDTLFQNHAESLPCKCAINCKGKTGVPCRCCSHQQLFGCLFHNSSRCILNYQLTYTCLRLACVAIKQLGPTFTKGEWLVLYLT